MFIPQKKLVNKRRRRQKKYLILLSNQLVIIDTEFQAMKRALSFKKPIVDMLPHSGRFNSTQVRNLNMMLEGSETN